MIVDEDSCSSSLNEPFSSSSEEEVPHLEPDSPSDISDYDDPLLRDDVKEDDFIVVKVPTEWSPGTSKNFIAQVVTR